jgi:DNA-binding NarL/FixJ family response regulator
MRITILIVDRQEIVRKLVRVALKGFADAVFLEAKDATEGLQIAREHREPIDLLISAVVLPGTMNGTEMAAQLSHARPEMKVVMMSGYPPDNRLRPNAASFAAYRRDGVLGSSPCRDLPIRDKVHFQN